MVCSKKLMRRPGAAVFLGKSLPFGLALNWRKEFLRIRCCFRDESAILDSKPLAELRFEVFELYVVLDCLRGVKDGFAPVHTCTCNMARRSFRAQVPQASPCHGAEQ